MIYQKQRYLETKSGENHQNMEHITTVHDGLMINHKIH